MPIGEHRLERRFILVDGTSTVLHLINTLQQHTIPPEYIITVLPEQSWSASLRTQLDEALVLLGSDALQMPVAHMPPMAHPTLAIERTEYEYGEARDLRDEQTDNRLIVLENALPVGLLTNEALNGVAHGIPLSLYGEGSVLPPDDIKQRIDAALDMYQCPKCRRYFRTYKITEKTFMFACPFPRCGEILGRKR